MKYLLAAAAIAMAPLSAAQAATVISDGFFDSYATVLTGSNSYVQEFEASEDLLVDLTFSGSGTPSNVSLLRYGVDGATNSYVVDVFGRLATGIGSLTDLAFGAGDLFAVTIQPVTALSAPTEVGFSIIASAEEAPAPIPLPAAAWMLLAGLGGLAAVRGRRAAA